MWKELEKNLGDLKEGSTTVVRFKLLKKISGFTIDKIETSCGCSKAKYDEKLNAIVVNFKAQKIPPHLEGQASYTAVKKVTVHTSRGKFTLKFKARITK